MEDNLERRRSLWSFPLLPPANTSHLPHVSFRSHWRTARINKTEGTREWESVSDDKTAESSSADTLAFPHAALLIAAGHLCPHTRSLAFAVFIFSVGASRSSRMLGHVQRLFSTAQHLLHFYCCNSFSNRSPWRQKVVKRCRSAGLWLTRNLTDSWTYSM